MSLRRSVRSITCLMATAVVMGLLVPSASAAPPTYVSFTFDNGIASQYTLGVQQALQPHGMHATFFVNSGTIGSSPNLLSWPQLTAVQAGGDEVGGKTAHFVDLTTAAPQLAIDEVCGDRQTLIQHGLDPVNFAYPYGAFNDAVKDVVRDCGYATARSGGGISAGGPNYVQPMPSNDPYGSAAFAPAGSVSLASLQAVVNGAAAQGGGWTQIVLQGVCSQTLDAAGYLNCKSSWGNVELDDLNAFLDWLAASGQAGGAPADTLVRTVRQVATTFDTSLPTTIATCEGAPCLATPYVAFALVTLTSMDSGSGVASTHYTTDGSDPTLSSPTYTAPIRLTTSTTLRFRSWDNAGNASAIGSQALLVDPGAVDTEAPVTTIACNGQPCSATAYDRAVIVSLSATDGRGSGVAGIHYTTDGTAPDLTSPTYTAGFEIQQSTTVRFFAVDGLGNAETPQTQQVQLTAAPVTVSLTWDDGKFSLYQLAWLRALQPHNVMSTFYINSGDTGTGESAPGFPGFMRWSDLAAMYAAGNEIGGHTVNHINLVTASDAERLHQVCDDRQALLLHGLHPTSFAYPEGALNPAVKDLVRNCGYANARSAGGVTSTGPVFAESLTPSDLYATQSWSTPANGREITLADMQKVVRSAASHGGGWVQILGHMVCSQQYFAGDYADCIAYASWMELDTLNAFLDWMQNAGQPGGAPAGVSFKTVRQVIGPNPSADTTAPATTIACNGAPCVTTNYSVPVTVALTATDAGSGVERTVYTTDGSDPTTSTTAVRYTGPFAISATRTIRYVSVDTAMNAEAAKSQRINIGIDVTPPVTTLTCNAAACSTGWYRVPVTVAMTATDPGSGVASTHYTTDGTAPALTSPLYTGPIQVTQTTTILYASWDTRGNREATKTRLVRIDGAAPTVAITLPLGGASIRISANQTTSATAADLGTGTGAASGIARVAWYLDGSTTALATDTSNPYSFIWRPRTVTLGVHTLTAIATDAAGNTRTSAPITVTITA